MQNGLRFIEVLKATAAAAAAALWSVLFELVKIFSVELTNAQLNLIGCDPVAPINMKQRSEINNLFKE